MAVGSSEFFFTLVFDCRRGKPHIFMNVQRARLVLGIKLLVLLAELGRINPTIRGGENTPRIIRVNRQQGVIQIEKNESLHVLAYKFNHEFSIIDLISGMVRGRFVCRE